MGVLDRQEMRVYLESKLATQDDVELGLHVKKVMDLIDELNQDTVTKNAKEAGTPESDDDDVKIDFVNVQHIQTAFEEDPSIESPDTGELVYGNDDANSDKDYDDIEMQS